MYDEPEQAIRVVWRDCNADHLANGYGKWSTEWGGFFLLRNIYLFSVLFCFVLFFTSGSI